MRKSRKSYNIYCNKCGYENSKKEKRCKKCHRRLDSWDIYLFSFLFNQGKSNGLDYVGSSAFETIKGVLMNSTFGIILTVSVTFASVATIVNYMDTNNINDENITVINHKIESKNTCNYLNTTDMIYKCPDTYTLNSNNECEKLVKTDAIETKTCESGYTLSKNICISNETTPVIETPSCVIPDNYTNTIIGGGDNRYTIHKENIYLTKVLEEKKSCYYYWCEDITTLTLIDDIPACAGPVSGGTTDNSLYKVVTSCPSGQVEVNGVCHKKANYKLEYSCSSGDLTGKKCIGVETTEAMYECPDGYNYNDECKICVGDEND